MQEQLPTTPQQDHTDDPPEQHPNRGATGTPKPQGVRKVLNGNHPDRMPWPHFTAVLGLRAVQAKLYSVERKAAKLCRDADVVVQSAAAEELMAREAAVRAELQTQEQLSAVQLEEEHARMLLANFAAGLPCMLAESHCWAGVDLDSMGTRAKLDSIYGTALSHPSLWLADTQQQLAALIAEETEARQAVLASNVQARWAAAAAHAIETLVRLKLRCALCGTPCNTRCGGCHTAAFCSRKCLLLAWLDDHQQRCRPIQQRSAMLTGLSSSEVLCETGNKDSVNDCNHTSAHPACSLVGARVRLADLVKDIHLNGQDGFIKNWDE
ncbi:MAG: zinc finger MYND domain-containing protein, partial [Herbaspirillum sp.]|nr:zinc finger MYND domain-containing protein [Herbaspirillum sp.]